MGKVKTKKISSLDRAKRTAAKTAIKAAKLAAREAALPAGTAPKLRHKDLKKLGKGKAEPAPQIDFDNLVITTAPERAKEALSHVKWTALFKKHLGVLESHVKALDRVAQHLQTYMKGLPEEERIKWEKGEEGNWGKICGLLDRARDTLCNAREASHGLVPEHHLRDKKGLGVTGVTYVALYPQVEARRAGLTVDAPGNGADVLGATANEPVDSDGDSEMEDAPSLQDSFSDSDSSSSDENDAEDNPAPEKKVKEKSKPAPEVEANPYFVVDTEPTPVNVPKTEAPSLKKGKKRTSDSDLPEQKVKKIKRSKSTESTSSETKRKDQSDEDIEQPEPKKSKKAKISKSEKVVVVNEPEPVEVDFHALQVQLQAEVDVKEATRDVEALGEEEKESRKEKKRRRSSDGSSEKEGKKFKKDKEGGKRRKA